MGSNKRFCKHFTKQKLSISRCNHSDIPITSIFYFYLQKRLLEQNVPKAALIAMLKINHYKTHYKLIIFQPFEAQQIQQNPI